MNFRRISSSHGPVGSSERVSRMLPNSCQSHLPHWKDHSGESYSSSLVFDKRSTKSLDGDGYAVLLHEESDSCPFLFLSVAIFGLVPLVVFVPMQFLLITTNDELLLHSCVVLLYLRIMVLLSVSTEPETDFQGYTRSGLWLISSAALAIYFCLKVETRSVIAKLITFGVILVFYYLAYRLNTWLPNWIEQRPRIILEWKRVFFSFREWGNSGEEKSPGKKANNLVYNSYKWGYCRLLLPQLSSRNANT